MQTDFYPEDIAYDAFMDTLAIQKRAEVVANFGDPQLYMEDTTNDIYLLCSEISTNSDYEMRFTHSGIVKAVSVFLGERHGKRRELINETYYTDVITTDNYQIAEDVRKDLIKYAQQ